MDVSLDTEGVKSLVARITYPQSAVTTIRDWSRINPHSNIEKGLSEEIEREMWGFLTQEEDGKLVVIVHLYIQPNDKGVPGILLHATISTLDPQTQNVTPTMVLRRVFEAVSILESIARNRKFQVDNLPVFTTFNQSWTNQPENTERSQEPLPDFSPGFLKYYKEIQQNEQ